jgi:hypothetical protein
MGVLLKSLVFRCVLLGGLFLAISISGICYHFGSPKVAFAYFRGEQFVVLPQVVDLGECEPGAERIAIFKVTNLADHPISIIGSEQECSCITLEKLPISLSPKENRDISLKIKLPASEKNDMSRKVVLFINDNELNLVPLSIRARVLPIKGGGNNHDSSQK